MSHSPASKGRRVSVERLTKVAGDRFAAGRRILKQAVDQAGEPVGDAQKTQNLQPRQQGFTIYPSDRFGGQLRARSLLRTEAASWQARLVVVSISASVSSLPNYVPNPYFHTSEEVETARSLANLVAKEWIVYTLPKLPSDRQQRLV